MITEFNPINKYAVALQYGDSKLRLVTQLRDGNGDWYQLAQYNEIDDVSVVDTIPLLILMLDEINRYGVLGSGGEPIDIPYELIPVSLSITFEDCTEYVQAANISTKRAKALSKLTNEDKLVLGITD